MALERGTPSESGPCSWVSAAFTLGGWPSSSRRPAHSVQGTPARLSRESCQHRTESSSAVRDLVVLELCSFIAHLTVAIWDRKTGGLLPPGLPAA